MLSGARQIQFHTMKRFLPAGKNQALLPVLGHFVKSKRSLRKIKAELRIFVSYSEYRHIFRELKAPVRESSALKIKHFADLPRFVDAREYFLQL